MQKIKSITLRNFKYFYGKETNPETQQNKIEPSLLQVLKLATARVPTTSRR